MGRAYTQHVDQREARVEDRFERLLEAASSVVFDHHTRAWREVGLEVGGGAAEVACADPQAAVVQAASERLALDEKFDLEAG